ncbi:MAG: hypothetical protein IAI49_03315, partial [Candidatus Eremiobacteraeota bacterium]|nr:hypothetical protein [Candidatus Eremiobacteraeota bacterium]
IVLTVAGIGAMLGTGDPGWQIGLIIGAGVALFMGCCAAGRFAPAVRFLSLAPIAGVGAFSFSLYLTHGPIVGLTAMLLGRYHASGAVWLVAYAITIPIAFAVAYVVYMFAERPFMSPTLRKGIAATASGVATAPVVDILVV